jgi:MFS family permease
VPVQTILLWAALPGALCVALALSLREPPPASPPGAARAARDWSLRHLPAGYLRLLAAVAVFTLGQASNAFILLRAAELGLPPAQVALLWALVAGSSTVLAVPLSSWSDRIGRLPLLLAGWSLYALLGLLLGSIAAAAALWPLAVLMGVYMAATEGSERALIADLVPVERLGTAYGWYYLTKGLLLLPASAIFGLIWHSFGASAAYGLGSLLAAAAALMLALLVRPALPRH